MWLEEEEGTDKI